MSAKEIYQYGTNRIEHNRKIVYCIYTVKIHVIVHSKYIKKTFGRFQISNLDCFLPYSYTLSVYGPSAYLIIKQKRKDRLQPKKQLHSA